MTEQTTLFQRISTLERDLKQAHIRIDQKNERIEHLRKRILTLRLRCENKDLRIAVMRRERDEAARQAAL